MALIARSSCLLVGLVLVAGCAAGPAGKDVAATTRKPESAAARAAPPARAPVPTPGAAPAADRESFARSGAALRVEIAERADAMKKGPIGSRGTQLASLRLASSGRDLIDAGSLDGALEALQRAVSLYGGNGYAYLYLAYVHHVQGRGEQAVEFAANARRYLPADDAVLAELESLVLSIRESTATAGR